MNLPVQVDQETLMELLWNLSPDRSMFIWGAPGIGKSAIVNQFAKDAGLPCVSLLGSQLAPEDIIGIPQIRGDVSEFLPPKMIARKEPYVLFLDELNACSHEVQKAFYSLIYERRIGEYHLPEGSIVIGAGNRVQDNAITRTMSSALVNRMFHVQMKVNTKMWLDWGYSHNIHPWVLDYITQRPDHLWAEPPKTEEPFSTPRSWHGLSDCLKAFGAGEKDVSEELLRTLAYGCVSASHAGMFIAYTRQAGNRNLLNDILRGEAKLPCKPEERDILYFLAQSLRAKLIHELPEQKQKANKEALYLAHRSKAIIKEIALVNYEIAQLIVVGEEEDALPEWFMLEIIRDLPRLIQNNEKR